MRLQLYRRRLLVRMRRLTSVTGVPVLLRIGEVAQATGVSTSALRFYEAQGLLTPTERTPAGSRRYDSEHVARVDFIRTAQRLGLTLAEIADLLAAVDSDDPVPARERLRRLVTNKIAATRHQIDELQAFSRQLERVQVRLGQDPGCGCRHLGTCGCLPLPPPRPGRPLPPEQLAISRARSAVSPDPGPALAAGRTRGPGGEAQSVGG